MKKALMMTMGLVIVASGSVYLLKEKFQDIRKESYVQGCAYAAVDIITSVSGMMPPVDAIVEKCEQIYNQMGK